jgi:glycosyltransferase involved in cell wall biosynthesis
MRLLFLTETVPFPLDSGGRIKTFNTLRILAPAHAVHCHALVRERAQLEHAAALQPYCADVVLHHVPRSAPREARAALVSQCTGVPFVVQRHFHRQVLEQLRRECARHAFDAVYCDHLSMLEYGRRLKLPIVLDAHNVEFEIIRRHAMTLGATPMRLFAELEWRRLLRYERAQYGNCRLIFSVSAIDATTIQAFAGDTAEVFPVPISVDVRGAAPLSGVTADPEILFVGGLHWPPNADAVRYFIEQVFPYIRAEVANAHLTVVGKDGDRLSGIAGRAGGITFAGHVPDVEPYFQRSRVMVVPIRSGSGMRVKILDAFARGVPTVTTTVGCEGIDVVPGVHTLVADEPQHFAREVVRVLRDDEIARRLARAGRALALERYDTTVVGRAMLAALDGAVLGRRRAQAEVLRH